MAITFEKDEISLIVICNCFLYSIRIFHFNQLYAAIIFDGYCEAGCLSPHKLSCNSGKYGTPCSSAECLCITAVGQPV